MNRREFLAATTAIAAEAAVEGSASADVPMPMTPLGKTGMTISKIVVGGYHMRVRSEEEGVRIIRRAVDLGVNFFDSAHLYHGGQSDITYGKALDPATRKKIFLHSKAEIYTFDGAMKELEETLTRMKTDYLDLWSCHQVSNHKEVDQLLGPRGSLEAFVKAKQQGKVRHIGFTGHHDPSVHVRMLESFNGWETVQHPVNLVDPHYESFIRNVLPKVRAKGLGMLAMKSNGIGALTQQKIATIDECLRFTWSQDIDALVSGMESVAELEHNVAACKAFVKMTPQEVSALLERTSKGTIGTKVENYKRSVTGASIRAHRDGDPA